MTTLYQGIAGSDSLTHLSFPVRRKPDAFRALPVRVCSDCHISLLQTLTAAVVATTANSSNNSTNGNTHSHHAHHHQQQLQLQQLEHDSAPGSPPLHAEHSLLQRSPTDSPSATEFDSSGRCCRGTQTDASVWGSWGSPLLAALRMLLAMVSVAHIYTTSSRMLHCRLAVLQVVLAVVLQCAHACVQSGQPFDGFLLIALRRYKTPRLRG
jgi:hypothetical protein